MTEPTVRRRLAVNGIGGVFLFSNNAKELTEWYTRHLGIVFTQYEGTTTYGMEFHYRFDRDPSMRASTVLSITQTDKPLSTSRNEFEVNYRVDDLHAFIVQLREDGVAIEKIEEFDYGRFAWVRDPDNNRIELYEPLALASDGQ
jgi:catechol 2,3-dioxygenase-like lactoylglutathione lyase family enzyme